MLTDSSLPGSTFGCIFTPNYGTTSFDTEAPGIGVSVGDRALATSDHPGHVPVSAARVSQEPPSDITPDKQEEHLQCLKELCELNIALFQHPLDAAPVQDQNTARSQAMHDTIRIPSFCVA